LLGFQFGICSRPIQAGAKIPKRFPGKIAELLGFSEEKRSKIKNLFPQFFPLSHSGGNQIGNLIVIGFHVSG
jgi:hypothetical protein